MNSDEFEGCIIETDESILKDLEEVEAQLAQRESLILDHGSIRDQLVALVKSQKLTEDDLVSKWLELYTVHTYWSKRKEEGK